MAHSAKPKRRQTEPVTKHCPVRDSQRCEFQPRRSELAMDFTGRPMGVFVYVESEGVATDAALAESVERGARFARSLTTKKEVHQRHRLCTSRFELTNTGCAHDARIVLSMRRALCNGAA